MPAKRKRYLTPAAAPEAPASTPVSAESASSFPPTSPIRHVYHATVTLEDSEDDYDSTGPHVEERDVGMFTTAQDANRAVLSAFMQQATQWDVRTAEVKVTPQYSEAGLDRLLSLRSRVADGERGGGARGGAEALAEAVRKGRGGGGRLPAHARPALHAHTRGSMDDDDDDDDDEDEKDEEEEEEEEEDEEEEQQDTSGARRSTRRR